MEILLPVSFPGGTSSSRPIVLVQPVSSTISWNVSPRRYRLFRFPLVWLSWLLKHVCVEYFCVVQGRLLWAVCPISTQTASQFAMVCLLFCIAVPFGSVGSGFSAFICNVDSLVAVRTNSLCGSGRCSFFGTTPDCFLTNTQSSPACKAVSGFYSRTHVWTL